MAELCEPCGTCSIAGKNVIVKKLTADLDRLMATGAYGEAYPVALRLLEEGEELYGPNSVDFASVLNDVASVERYLGKYEDAEQRFRGVARILRECVGEVDPEYATAINNLAGLHRLTGAFELAEREFEDSLALYRRTLGEYDWRTISCYNNMGLLYQDQGRLDEALACHVKALELLQAPEAVDDPAAVAVTLMNGAICSAKMGDTDEAHELFTCSLQLTEQIHGRESAAFAGALNNVAAFSLEQGETDYALKLLAESQGITKRLFGADSSAYKLVCSNIERARGRADGAS